MALVLLNQSNFEDKFYSKEPLIKDNNIFIDNEIDNINIFEHEEVFLPESTESEPLLKNKISTFLESKDINEFGEPHHLEVFLKNDTANDIDKTIDVSSSIIIGTIVPLLILIILC
jgi:hypothetical protein